MTNVFFGINITEDNENDRMDGEDFVAQYVSESQEKALDQNGKDMMALQNKANLPLPLRALRYMSAFVFLCFTVGIVRGLGKVTLAEAFRNAPWIFVILPIAAAAWIVLSLLQRKRHQAFDASPEVKAAIVRSQALNQRSYESLGVPADALTADVLCSRYVIKKDTPVNRPFGPYTFIATEIKMYVEGELLMLVDLHQRFSIPLSSLTGLRVIQKPVTLPIWNKEAPIDQEPYKDYALTVNQNGVHFKYYHALCITREDGVQYELYFPPYEIIPFEALTGLHAPIPH
jgi:hypothetical protein